MTQILGNLFISGETTIKDDSNSNHIVESHGNVSLTSSTKGWGNSSISFDGTNSYLSALDNDDWNFGTGNFTIDFWINSNINTTFPIIGQWTDNSNRWILEYVNTTGFRFISQNDTDGLSPITFGGTINTDEWIHIAFVKVDDIFKFYKDGIAIYSNQYFGTFNIRDYTGPIIIGNNLSTGVFFNGYLDNIRVVKGQALWTSNFNLTEEELFYPSTNFNPNRPINIKGLYDVTLKMSIRNAAKNGFVRPTLSEMFMTHKDFVEVPSVIPVNPISLTIQSGSTAYLTNNNLTSNNTVYGNWNGAVVNIPKSTGKWYLEFIRPVNMTFSVGVKDVTNINYQNHYAPSTSISYLANYIYQGAMGGPLCPTAPPAGTTMAVAYDIENHFFSVYANGTLFFEYNANPSYYLNGEIIFFTGSNNLESSVTINATPTYNISGYSYIN